MTTPGVPDAANQEDPNIPGGATDAGGNSDAGNGVQIAAAVGINITNHKAQSFVTGSLIAQDVLLHAENKANFRARGNAATVTLSAATCAIAAGVAVSVNNNQSVAENSGTIITRLAKGAQKDAPRDLTIVAVHTANMDGIYRGTLGAQALQRQIHNVLSHGSPLLPRRRSAFSASASLRRQTAPPRFFPAVPPVPHRR